MSWTIPNLVISFVHLRHRQHRRILPAASASERFVGIDQRMKAGPDGNHGFLLRRAVRIRQSAWGVAPRRLTRRPVSLTILAVIKLTPSRCGSRRSIAADVKKLGGPPRRRLSASLFPQELSIRNLLNRYTAKHGIVLEVLLDKTVVRGPTHLGRFRRNPPVIQIR